MGSFDISIAQKVVVAVALPVASFLLYFLLKKSNEEEEEPRQRVVTSRQTLIEVKVPRSAAGSIIGPRGARIKEVQDSTGARIQFKDDVGSDNTERTVVIRGQVEAAQRAEMIIRHMIAEIPPIVKDSLNVPERAIGRIIGRGGETIRSLCRSSKCKINVPQEQKLGGIQRILLEGSPTAISTAKALIEEKVKEEEAFRARIAVNASNRQERGPRRREGGTENTHQEAAPLLQAEEDSWDSQPKSEPARTDDVADSIPSPVTLAPEAAKWTNHRDYLEVYVSAVEHPGHLWVQVISSRATKLDDLSQDMTRFYSHMNEGEAATVGEIQEGDLLAAPFPFDDQWYRVRVTEVGDDKVDAYYVDFGDSYWVEKSKLKSLRSDFLSLPFQAIEVCLANVQPNGDTWSEDANILFEELTHMAKWKVVNARTVSYMKTDDGESMPCLELIDTNGAKDVNVAKVLIERGYAVYIQEKEAVTSSDVLSNTQIDDSITYEEIAPESENKLMSSVDPHFSSPRYCRKRMPHRNSQEPVNSSEEKRDLFAEKDLINTVSHQSDVSHNVYKDISTIVETKVPFDDTTPSVHLEPFDQRLLQATFLEGDFVSDLDVFYDAKEDQVKESSDCELKAYCPSDVDEHATVKMEGVNDFSEDEVALNSVKMEGDDNTVLLETSIQLIPTQHENSENMTVQNKNELLVSETKDQLAIRPKTLDVDTREDISIEQPLHGSKMAVKQLYLSSLSSKEECPTWLSESCHTTAEQKVSFHDTCDVTDNSACNMKGGLSDVCVEVPQMVNIGAKDDEYAPESVNAVHDCSQKPTSSCVSTDRRDICLNTVDESIDTSCIYGYKEDISKRSDFGNVFTFDESHVDSDINTQGSLHDPCDNFSIRYAEGPEAGAKEGCEVREPSSAADYNKVFGSDQAMPFDECSSHSKTADCQAPISHNDEKCVESKGTIVHKGISEAKKVGNFGFKLNNSVCSAEDVHVSSHAVGGSSSPRSLDMEDHSMLNSTSLLVLGRQCAGEDDESVGQLLEEMCSFQEKTSGPITSAEGAKSHIDFTREVLASTCLSQDEEQNVSISDMSEVCPPKDTDLSTAKLSSIPVYETQYVKELISSPQADSKHCSDETHLSEVFVDRQFALVEQETTILVENLAVEACKPEDTDFARAEQSSVSGYETLHVKEEEVISQQVDSSQCSDKTRESSVNRESALVDNDSDILVKNPLLDTESKGSHISVECRNDRPTDVNCEQNNTLMTSSSELQIIHLKVDDILVPGIQHQLHETPSSSAESFNAIYDKLDAQPDAVCSTETPSVGRLPGDLTLTSNFEIKAEQSDCDFTRDIQEVDYSDDKDSSVDALCTKSFDVPICDTTACLNKDEECDLSQDEERDLSIPDISEACTQEDTDLSRDGQTSIPECETQHVKEEQVIPCQQDDSDNCSDQMPVPLEHLGSSYEDSDHLSELLDRQSSDTDIPVQCPNEELKDVNCEQNNTRMMLSSDSENVNLEQTEVLLPEIRHQEAEILSSSVESFNVLQLQNQDDAQPDGVCYTEDPLVGTMHDDSVLSPRSEVQTEHSDIAFTREVMAIDCTDCSEHTSTDGMSTETSEVPIWDTTTCLNQDKKLDLSIPDISEAWTQKDTDLSRDGQTSISECETQHVNEEQVISCQQYESDNCSDQIPVPLKHLAPSYEDSDHLSESLVEKETDMPVEKADVKLLDRESSETDIPVQCPNEELTDVNCEQNNTRMMFSSESKNLDLEQTEVLLPEIQHQDAEILSSYAESFNLPVQNHKVAQPDGVCSTENHSVGTLHEDLVLLPSSEVQTEQSDIAFTREVMEVYCTDYSEQTSADGVSTETSEIPICDTTTRVSQDEEQNLSITEISEAYMPENTDLSRAEQSSFPECETQYVKEEQLILCQQVDSEHCPDQTHLSGICVDRQFTFVEKETEMLVESLDLEACTPESTDFARAEQSSGPLYETQHVTKEQVISPQVNSKHSSGQTIVSMDNLASSFDDEDILSEASLNSQLTILNKDTDILVENTDVKLLNRESKETDIPVECPHERPNDVNFEQNIVTLFTSSSESQNMDLEQNEVLMPGIQHQEAEIASNYAESFNVPVQNQNNAQTDDVCCTENPSVGTLHEDSVLSPRSEVQTEQSDIAFTTEVIAIDCSDDIVHSSADAISTETFDIPICDTTTCLDQDIDQNLSITDTNEPFTLEDTDFGRVKQSSIPVYESQHVKEQQVISSDISHADSEPCSNQSHLTKSCMNRQFPSVEKNTDILVENPDFEFLDKDSTEPNIAVECLNEELRNVSCERNTRMTSSSASQNMDIEQNTVLVPGIQHQQCEIPSSSAESSNISLQDHHDAQSDTVCCTEDLSVGTLDDDLILSSSFEVQTERSNIAFTREVIAVDCSDATVHSSADAMSIESSEIPLCDTTMHFSQNEEHSLSITDTSESCAPEDCASAEQISIPVYESQHATEQVLSSQEIDSEHCSHQTPVPLASSSGERDHVSEANVNRQYTLAEKDTDIVLENQDYELLDRDITKTNMPVEFLNEELKDVNCEQNALMMSSSASQNMVERNEVLVPEIQHQQCKIPCSSAKSSNISLQDHHDAQSNVVCCTEDPLVGTLDDDSVLSPSAEVRTEQTETLSEAAVPGHLDLEDKNIDDSHIPVALELKDPETEDFEDCPTLMVLEEHDLQVAQHQSVPELLTAELKKVPQAVYSPPQPPEVVELNTPSYFEPGGTGLQKSGSIESRCSPESSNRALEDVHPDITERPLQTANMEKHETSLDEPSVLEVQEEPAEHMEYPLQFSSGAEMDDKDEPEDSTTKQSAAYAQNENVSMSNEGLSSSQSEGIRNPVEASICQLQDTLPGQIQSPAAELHNVQTDCTEITDAGVLDDSQGAFETTSCHVHDIEGGQEEMSEEISVVRTDNTDPTDCHHEIVVVQSSELQKQTDFLTPQQQKGMANIEPSSANTKLDAVPLDMSKKEETEFCEICGIPVDHEEDLITTGGQMDGPTERISSSDHKSCLQEMDNKVRNNVQSSITENIESIEPPLNLIEEMTSNDDQINRRDTKKSEEVTDSEINIDNTAVGNRSIPLYSKTPDKHSPEPEDRSYMKSDNCFSAEPIRHESNRYGSEMYQQKACDDPEHVEVTLCTTWDPEHQVSEMEEKPEADVKFVQLNVDSEESLEDSMSERTVVSLSFGSEVTSGPQLAGIGHERPEGKQRTHYDGKTITVTHAADMEVDEPLLDGNAEQAPDIRGSSEELLEQMEGEIENHAELNHHEIHEQQVVANLRTQIPMTTETTEDYLTEVDRFQKSTTQMSEMGHSGYFDTIEHMCTEDTCRSPDVDSAYESPTRPTYLHTSSITDKMVIDTEETKKQEETNLPLDDINQQNSECLIISSLGENLLQKDEPENLQPDISDIMHDEYTTLISSMDHSKEELPGDWSGEDRRNQIEVELSMEEKDDNKGEITKRDNHKHQEEGLDDQLEESNCSGDEDAPNQMPSLMGRKMYKDLLEVITSDGSESVDSGLQLQDHLLSDDSKHDAIKEWLMVQASPVLDTSSSMWSDGSNTSSCRELIDACQGEECLEIDVPCCMEASVDERQDMGIFPPTESFILNPSAGECGAFDSLYKSDKFPTDKKGEFASFRLHSSMEDESRNPELVSSNYDEKKLTEALKGCQESLSDAFFKIEPSYADATARKEVSDRLVGHLAPQYAPSFRRCSSTGDIETERETEYTALASWSEDEYTGGRRRYAYDDQYGVEYDDDSSSMDSLEEQTYAAASAMRHRSPSRGCTSSGAAGQLRQCSRGETRHCSLYDEFQDMMEEFYGHTSLVSVESATATTSTSYASALEDLPSDDVEQVMTDSLEELTAEDIGVTYPDILYPPSSRSSISQDSLNDIDDISSTYGGGEEICETNSSFTDDSIEDAYDTDEGGPRVIYGTQLEQTLFDANITPTVESAAPFPASPTTPTASLGSEDSQSLSHTEQSPCLPADSGKYVS